MQRSLPHALLYIGLTIALTVAGQLLVKRGVMEIGGDGGALAFFGRAATNLCILLGLASAVLAAGCWMGALAHADLSFAYPFMGLAIVLVLALSPLAFGEPVPTARWIGVLVVCAGLVIASRGD